MDEMQIAVLLDIKAQWDEADELGRMLMAAYYRGQADGRKLAQMEAAKAK